jgi:hypothetical protein
MTDTPVSPDQPEPMPEQPMPEQRASEQAPAAEAAYTSPPVMAAPNGVAATLPVGKVRETGMCFLLMIVTLGFYSFYWYFKTHDEMKRHSGSGLGGGIALLLAIVVGIVMPFLNSNEVGQLYTRRGQKPPVTAVTGLWVILLGWLLFVGIIVWFVKTNNALNEYWRSLGAR